MTKTPVKFVCPHCKDNSGIYEMREILQRRRIESVLTTDEGKLISEGPVIADSWPLFKVQSYYCINCGKTVFINSDHTTKADLQEFLKGIC